jgi:phenylpropionate dioxygenase-like ring-hydroxylating dioxygenase large terminal subunit
VYYDNGAKMSDSAHVDENATPATSHDADFLLGFWYPAMRSNQLNRRQMQTAKLLEIPLVIGRDAQGKPFAMRDACPHRGMPLSFGRLDGSGVECSYHGWQFDVHSGQCAVIPSLTADSKLKCDRIFADAFPCAERDGYIWVYFPDGDLRAPRSNAIPPVPELPKFGERFRMAHFAAEMPVSVDNGIIGLMDPAHGPLVVAQPA